MRLPAMQETQELQVQSLGQQEPLEEEMATLSSILTWKIPWTEEPGGLQSSPCGPKESDTSEHGLAWQEYGRVPFPPHPPLYLHLSLVHVPPNLGFCLILSISYLKTAAVPLGEGNGTPLQDSCLENPMDRGAWWAAVHGVTKNRTRLSDFTFTVHFHALEMEMATHSSVLAWRIPGMGEPGGLLSVGSHRVRHD